MNHVVDENILQDPPVDEQLPNTDVDDILKDPTKRSEILKKLGLPDPSTLTPSGTATGGGSLPPQMWCPFLMYPPRNPAFGPHLEGPFRQQSTPGSGVTEIGKDDEDVVDLLDDDEALEFMEFDPTVEAPSTWPHRRQCLVF